MKLYSIFSIITIFFFVLSLIKLLKNGSSKASKKLPPGPWKLPIIGSLHHLATGSSPKHNLSRLSKKYGPLMHLKLGEFSAVVVSSPHMAKLLMKTHDPAFAGRVTNLATDIFTYNRSDIAFSNCNAYWQQMRKISTLELLSNKRVKSYSSIREDEVSNLVTFVGKSVGSPIHLRAQLSSLTNSVTLRAAFGDEFLLVKSSLLPLLDESVTFIGGFNLCDIFPSFTFLPVINGMKSKLLKIHKKMDIIFEDIINKRRQYNAVNGNSGERGNQNKDLLDVLLRLQQENKQELSITDDSIKAMIFDMFLAGTDTSATTIEWAMAEIIKNPRVMEKAQSGLRRSLDKIKDVEESDTQELDYLKLIIKETLRLHPPAPLLLPRECMEAREIDGYTIPVKTMIIVNAWAIARNPEIWEDADKFIPERFEKNVIDYNGNNFEYIPFGAGKRICPGISFGLAIVELVLAQLLYHFNWKIPNQMKPDELDMEDAPGLNGFRKNPLYLVADFSKVN